MNVQRLLKLADFLEKLPRKKFDFRTVITGPKPPRKELDCGSVACAMGWTPAVFPRLVEAYVFSDEDPENIEMDVRLKADKECDDYCTVAEELFGLDEKSATGLFTPGHQDYINEPTLYGTATPKQVAALIRRYVKKNSKKVPA